MRDRNSSKALRFTAGLTGLLLLVIVLFSSFYIAAEAHHECHEDDCPICECVRLCETTLRGIGDGAPVRSFTFAPVFVVLAAAIAVFAVVSGDTLVSKKVRLND